MIQPRKSQTISFPALPWPECYYAETDPALRLQMLNEHMDEDPDGNQIRLQLHQRRYVTKKKLFFSSENVDMFMRSWMLMKVSATQAEEHWQEAALVKEWRGYMKNLLLADSDYADGLARELLCREWTAFFEQYLALCLHDRTFSTALSGTIHLSRNAIAEKIAAEWELLTEEFPEKLHLSEDFYDFHRCAADVYRNSTIL